MKTLDLAKRLLDYGFHPPTVYFPLLVDEALMVEPTETETRETLDAFAEARRRDLRRGRGGPDGGAERALHDAGAPPRRGRRGAQPGRPPAARLTVCSYSRRSPGREGRLAPRSVPPEPPSPSSLTNETRPFVSRTASLTSRRSPIPCWRAASFRSRAGHALDPQRLVDHLAVRDDHGRDPLDHLLSRLEAPAQERRSPSPEGEGPDREHAPVSEVSFCVTPAWTRSPMTTAGRARRSRAGRASACPSPGSGSRGRRR